jgi:excisionase family DNA binding protein
MYEPEERWRTTAEALEYLAISDATLQRWIVDRGMPVHRVGRTLRFKFSELDSWVRNGVTAGHKKGSHEAAGGA